MSLSLSLSLSLSGILSRSEARAITSPHAVGMTKTPEGPETEPFGTEKERKRSGRVPAHGWVTARSGSVALQRCEKDARRCAGVEKGREALARRPPQAAHPALLGGSASHMKREEKATFSITLPVSLNLILQLRPSSAKTHLLLFPLLSFPRPSASKRAAQREE